MNKNVLKIIAMISMLIDHIGLIFFPGLEILRSLGRVAFPLFAFSIGEGCLYTKNKLRYFLQIFSLGFLCQVVYLFEELISYGKLSSTSSVFYLNILLTFSCSIGLCYLYLYFKQAYENKLEEKIIFLRLCLFVLALLFAFFVNYLFEYLRTNGIASQLQFDYDFVGMILPLLIVMGGSSLWKRKALFAVGVIFLAFILFQSDPYWFYPTFVSIPILLFYNGERGKLPLKYLFYIFYPLHLALLYLIAVLVSAF